MQRESLLGHTDPLLEEFYPEPGEDAEEEELEDQMGAMNTHRLDPQRELHSLAFDNKDKDYRWVKVIGQGAFGVVFQAYNLKSLETVAIKKVYQDPKCRNREFTIVIDLDHRNVIKVHDYFFTKHEENELDVYLNIVMDFYPTTLNKILRYYHKMGKQFPPMLLKLLLYQLLRALAYIRGKGILHRDIKPQNILVDTKDYRLILCDFGSAKIFSREEESIAYICSRFYRSPELILGEKNYSHEVDVWAAGCVVGEMILGEPLFCGNNNKEQFLRIVNILGPPTEADLQAMGYSHRIAMPKFTPLGLKRKLGPGVEPLLLDLMSKLLAYNPKTRIAPFHALAHPYFDELRKHRILVNGRSTGELFDFSREEIGGDEKLLSRLFPVWHKSN
jgi:serine/threonine protein kinase